jgi:hypothetical protein
MAARISAFALHAIFNDEVNETMNVKVWLTLLLLGVFAGGAGLVVHAQDSDSSPNPGSATEEAEPQVEPPAPEPEDDVFIPSEEIQADEELPFPVDI